MGINLGITLVFAVLNAMTYRAGGSGNYPRWLRPFGVGMSVMVLTWLWAGFHWSLLLSAGLSAVLSTTYFKPDGKDARWFNWLAVGVMLSIAMLPWVWASGHWLGFGIRTVVLGAAVCAWSELVGDAVLEELGRGFLIVATLPLLLG